MQQKRKQSKTKDDKNQWEKSIQLSQIQTKTQKMKVFKNEHKILDFKQKES